MLSNLSKSGSDKINLSSILGICGIFLLGPLGYLSVGNIYLQSILDGNYYFDPALTNVWSILTTVNLLYLFALAGGIPGLAVGFTVGKYSGQKLLGMEIGLISGMLIWPFLNVNFSSLEMLSYSIGGLTVGVLSCFLGRKIGQHVGNRMLQKINSH